MNLKENVESYLHSKGMYLQRFTTNEKLLENFNYDNEYKFYTSYKSLSINNKCDRTKIYLPFVIYIGTNRVTFKCVGPWS